MTQLRFAFGHELIVDLFEVDLADATGGRQVDPQGRQKFTARE